DLTGNWAEPYILDMVDNGAISGFDDGTFRPEAKVTRAQVAKMLIGATQAHAQILATDDQAVELYKPIPPNSSKAPKDVPEWAKPFVGGAVQAGAIKGFAGGNFKPDLPVTKLQLAVIIGRLIPDRYAKTTPWKDVPGWAKNDVAKAYGLGAVDGDSKFDPNKELTRAEVAMMLDVLMRSYDIADNAISTVGQVRF
ncbi:MAG: S-layer homology domain-containing protein, partial [Bacillota bacterium]